MSEHEIQTAIVQYLRTRYPQAVFTSTMGGVRLTIGAAMKAKRAGYQAGIPDLLILHPNAQYHGMAIEVKTTKGKPSIQQVETLKRLNAVGYLAYCVHDIKTAVDMIDIYFSLT